MKGIIKKLIKDRGFGFISTEGDKEVFFHSSALPEGKFDTLEEGMALEYEVEKGPKGPRAVNVKVTEA